MGVSKGKVAAVAVVISPGDVKPRLKVVLNALTYDAMIGHDMLGGYNRVPVPVARRRCLGCYLVASR